MSEQKRSGKGGMAVCSGLFLLKISNDRMEAYLEPQESGASLAAIPPERLKTELDQCGVIYGLLNPPVFRPDGTFLVAKGKPVENGEDAKIKPHVKPAVVRSPKVTDVQHDKVDFRELGTIVNVPAEILLMEKLPPTAGNPGVNVLGVSLPAKSGRDVKLKVGKGVRLSEDELQMFSTEEGKFLVADGRASVLPEHKVTGDVDLSVGNIVFAGKALVISGSVLPGFSVKCKGDVEVGARVHDARVVAGGNLVIKGGVIGEEVVLKSWQDVTVQFMENAGRVEVKGNLVCNDTIIQTNVRVGKNIYATKGKGTLIGGKFVVGGSVYVKELGSEAEVMTEVTVGMNPELEEKKKKLEEDKLIWPEKMNEMLKNINTLKQQKREGGGKLPPEKEEMLKKLNSLLPQVMDQVSKITEREEAMKEEIMRMANEAIHIYGTVYPGVTVKIGGVVRILTSEEHGVILHLDLKNRQIHCRAMSPEERQATPA